jgi:hypothetical protein
MLLFWFAIKKENERNREAERGNENLSQIQMKIALGECDQYVI